MTTLMCVNPSGFVSRVSTTTAARAPNTTGKHAPVRARLAADKISASVIFTQMRRRAAVTRRAGEFIQTCHVVLCVSVSVHTSFTS